jgi:hypothetical protein
MAERRPLLAVLIDGDNTSPRHAPAIFEEIAGMGEASVRRVYGDFSSPQMNGWSKVQAEHGIVPHHSPAHTVGKNSSDISLVIDAMVSSDSDFTRLASRIREQGLDVFGIGQAKTPEAFRMACKRFIFLENLGRAAKPEATVAPAEEQDALRVAREVIGRAIDALEGDEEGWVGMGPLGQYLVSANPDFDTRTYGRKKLSDLIADLKVFETRKGAGGQVVVRRVD